MMNIAQSSNSNFTPWNNTVQFIKRSNRTPKLPTSPSGQIQDCRRCGHKYPPGHMNICPAKNKVCRIFKKIRRLEKLCKTEMAPNSKFNMQQRAQNQYPDIQQTQRQNRLVTNPKQQKVKKNKRRRKCNRTRVNRRIFRPGSNLLHKRNNGRLANCEFHQLLKLKTKKK